MNGTLRAASKLPTTSCRPPPIHPTKYLSLLQSITQSRYLWKGKQLHAYIITSGLSPTSPHHHDHHHHEQQQQQQLLSRLASMYALCGDMASAHHLFDEIPLKTTFLWNTFVRGYGQIGLPYAGLQLFQKMGLAGNRPDRYTFTFLLKACADLSVRGNGVQVHCRALVAGFGFDGHVQNSLISAYMSCSDEETAGQVFGRMHDRTVVSWNTMIAGFVGNGYPEGALKVFDQMLEQGEKPDRATVISVLPACASTKDLNRGRLVHKVVAEKGYSGFIPARNSLIDMYTKCGRLDSAMELFNDAMYEKDVVSWTAIIGGCVLNGCMGEALALSCDMQFSRIRPNAVTTTSMLSACSSPTYIRHGKCIHGMSIRLYVASEIIVETSLVEMYGRCGNMNRASLVFNSCSRRTATWNSLISCYRRNQLAREAVDHFRLMLVDGFLPNNTTIMCVLPAYSDLVDLQQAKNIHCYLMKTGFTATIEVITGLVDLYSKIGSLDVASKLFNRLPDKDIVAWSAIIAGYGKHGHANMAIELFDQMMESGIEPNDVTFMSILYSCSHAGLVDEGFEFFKRMTIGRCTRPGADHYACIVDLLGRAGRLDSAHELIKGMPYDPNYAVWGAFLGACVIHGNVELGEEAAQHLFELEPENTGNYVLLGNLYAAVGRWDDAELVRNMVKERGLSKSPGCSLVDVNNSDSIALMEEPTMEARS